MSNFEDDRCVLCLDGKRSPVRIQCGHSFCHECLKVYKSYQKYSWANKCPICRSKLKENKKGAANMNSSSAESSLQNQSLTPSSSGGIPNNSLLEQFIAIATDDSLSSGQLDSSILSVSDPNITPSLRITGSFSDSDSGDRMYGDMDEDDHYADDERYFSNSDEENYYYFEEDAISWDQQTTMNDYEQDVILEPEDSIVIGEEGSVIRLSDGGVSTVGSQESPTEVVILDDVIIVD